jgi:hypothetical protein
MVTLLPLATLAVPRGHVFATALAMYVPTNALYEVIVVFVIKLSTPRIPGQ